MRLFSALLVIGCGGAIVGPKERPLPNEQDACPRLCERMTTCEVAPPSCAASCAADQARFRPGVQPAYAACVERELAHCDSASPPDRRQALSLCWSATLEAYAKDDDALRTIVRAICARLARCDGPSECETTLMQKLSGSAQSKTWGLVRKELVTSTATCIEKTGCSESDPIGLCSEGAK